jgi:hypothetical protein
MLILVGVTLIATASAIIDHEVALAIVFVVFFAACLLFRLWITPRRLWRTAPGIREPRRVTINDEGVVSEVGSIETRFDWSQFAGTRETNEYLYFFPSQNSARFAIPKRGLRSVEDAAMLRTLIERHAPAIPEDRLMRPGLASKLVLLSLAVILLMIVIVEVQIR